MSESIKPIVAHPESSSGSVRTYVAGFVLSLILTLAAYLIATRNTFTGWGLVYALAALAITQLVVQLVFFLHLGRESRPRWNLTVALFAVMVVSIVVFGSLWIMKNLNYRHMHGLTPTQTDKLIIHDEGYGQ